MTTKPATTTGNINIPANVRIAHIVVTPPSVYASGGFAIPLPAGFRGNIKAAFCNQRFSATLGSLWYFDVATQKLFQYVAGTAGAANPLIEGTAASVVGPIDIIAFDWDEDNTTVIAAS